MRSNRNRGQSISLPQNQSEFDNRLRGVLEPRKNRDDLLRAFRLECKREVIRLRSFEDVLELPCQEKQARRSGSCEPAGWPQRLPPPGREWTRGNPVQ